MILRICCCYKYMQKYEDTIIEKQKEIDDLKREIKKCKTEIKNSKNEIKLLREELDEYNNNNSNDSYSFNSNEYHRKTSEDIELGYTVFD